MEQFVVSARKYRPQTFKDVVGQQAITNTLLNAIENNHLAQNLLNNPKLISLAYWLKTSTEAVLWILIALFKVQEKIE